MTVNPALPAIVAKIMTLVDQVLGVFCTTTWLVDPGGTGCDIPVIYSNMTTCGNELVDLWAQALYAISGLVGTMVASLGVNIQ